jgi:hypothetical protein
MESDDDKGLQGVSGSCSSSSCIESDDDNEVPQAEEACDFQHQVQNTTPCPQMDQVFYYVALPGTTVWEQVTGMNASHASATQTSNIAELQARVRSAELEAQAAEFQLAAARLKAAARQLSTQSCVSPQALSLHFSVQQEAWQKESGSSPNFGQPQEELTTLMLRNIPNDYTRQMLLNLLDSQGLGGRYNFVYLPIDFHRTSSLGYAFMNLVSHEDAQNAMRCLHGFKDWAVASQKICQVCWGEPLQGLAAHVERYRSSPVMHNDVPDEFKPVLFENGVRVQFPSATKRVRRPRSKRVLLAGGS